MAATGKARSDDPDFRDAVLLANHPGWSYDDLGGTPVRVLRIMAKLDAAKPRSGP